MKRFNWLKFALDREQTICCCVRGKIKIRELIRKPLNCFLLAVITGDPQKGTNQAHVLTEYIKYASHAVNNVSERS